MVGKCENNIHCVEFYSVFRLKAEPGAALASASVDILTADRLAPATSSRGSYQLGPFS